MSDIKYYLRTKWSDISFFFEIDVRFFLSDVGDYIRIFFSFLPFVKKVPEPTTEELLEALERIGNLLEKVNEAKKMCHDKIDMAREENLKKAFEKRNKNYSEQFE